MKKNFNYFAGMYALGICAVLSVSACQKQPQVDQTASTTTLGNDVDDSLITTKVKSALMNDEDIKSIDFKVTTDQGNVILSGIVNNQMQIDRSLMLVKTVSGVKNVTNQLTIKTGTQSMGAKIDDSVITTKVKSAFLTDSMVKSFDVGVVTKNGEVQLSGFVATDAQLKHVVDVAQAVEGVTSVINHMTIK